MNFIQTTIQLLEVGKARIIVRIVPLMAMLLIVGGAYDMVSYRGLADAQSMDNAQLARQLVRHLGFTTFFLRPQALAQLRDHATTAGLDSGRPGDLFPAAAFPPGAPKYIPDTYNAPGFPVLLAIYDFVIHPDFDQPADSIIAKHMYSGDRWIPLLNQALMLLTAGLVFALGYRLFDDRVAWVALLAFLGTDLVWSYTLTALSTSLVMFLITAMLMCVLEIYAVSEASYLNEDRPFGPAWAWILAVIVLLGLACLTRLHLVVLLIPLVAMFVLMPRGSVPLALVTVLAVVSIMLPWFLREYRISGNPLGSNFPLFLSGEGDYAGNQIYCATSIPTYDPVLKDATTKEWDGLRYHFEHAWTLLGNNPLVIFFVVAILHPFKRRRTRAFHWLLFGCGAVLILANNLATAEPLEVSQWNVVVLLLPCMLVIGAAYFFVLLDRINFQVPLMNTIIVTILLTLCMLPMIATLTTPTKYIYAFPPYMPPYIKLFGSLARPDEWITSDIPWASAWYADHPSLWLPDTISDFANFQDNVCPTGIMLLTPESTSHPVSDYTTGEYKDWLPFLTGINPPSTFPLSEHYSTPAGGPDYIIWSDRPRWQQ